MSRTTLRADVTIAAVIAILGCMGQNPIAVGQSRKSDESTLRLMATPGPASLGQESPVLFTLTLEVAKQHVVIPGVLLVGGNVSLEVVGPSGDRLPYLGEKSKLIPFRREQFLSLSPTYFYGRTLNLRDFFRLQIPGRYRVRAAFNNSDKGTKYGIDAWTGEVVADELSIEVP